MYQVGTGGALAGTSEGSLRPLLLCHQWTTTAVMRVGMVGGASSLRNSIRGAATDDGCLFACIFLSVKIFFDMFGAGILVSQ